MDGWVGILHGNRIIEAFLWIAQYSMYGMYIKGAVVLNQICR